MLDKKITQSKLSQIIVIILVNLLFDKLSIDMPNNPYAHIFQKNHASTTCDSKILGFGLEIYRLINLCTCNYIKNSFKNHK